MTTLISFIGKGRVDAENGYQTVTYRFDPDFARTVPFFGLALTEFIKPDRLVLVGTAGSMWDVFFERQGATDDEFLALIDAVATQVVNAAMLERQQQRLSDKLGLPVTCLLIPYARDSSEQAEILGHLAGVVKPGETIDLDVTHGFRHLPMLALVAARYLTHVAKVTVRELYYGALEMTPPGGETPVLKLGGMLQMLDWVETLATYEKDGDYGAFSTLLDQEGLPGKLLAEAAYFERSANTATARSKLDTFDRAKSEPRTATGKLFLPELKKRISWRQAVSRAQWEAALARQYLSRRDYLRAATFGYESLVTEQVEKTGGNDDDRNVREAADKILYEAAKGPSGRGEHGSFKQLKDLRNELAHGVRSSSKTSKDSELVSDETRLAEWLKKAFKELLPG